MGRSWLLLLMLIHLRVARAWNAGKFASSVSQSSSNSVRNHAASTANGSFVTSSDAAVSLWPTANGDLSKSTRTGFAPPSAPIGLNNREVTSSSASDSVKPRLLPTATAISTNIRTDDWLDPPPLADKSSLSAAKSASRESTITGIWMTAAWEDSSLNSASEREKSVTAGESSRSSASISDPLAIVLSSTKSGDESSDSGHSYNTKDPLAINLLDSSGSSSMTAMSPTTDWLTGSSTNTWSQIPSSTLKPLKPDLHPCRLGDSQGPEDCRVHMANNCSRSLQQYPSCVEQQCVCLTAPCTSKQDCVPHG